MRKTNSLWDKFKMLVGVMMPIFVTQLALLSTGFFDTVMAGHASEYDLAGVAIGSNLFFPVFGGLLGVLSGLTPIIAQLNGAGKKTDIPFVVVQGMYLALAIGVSVIIIAAVCIDPLLNYMNLNEQVQYVAYGYLTALAWGFCPILVATVLRNFIDALGYTRITMIITIIAVPVNILMNYIFIFGKWGVPAYGGIGAGIGSAISYWLVLILNLLVIKFVRPFNSYQVLASFSRPNWRALLEHLRVGIPIGSAMFCEQSIFGAVGLFMAAYGTYVIAAHQAALNFTTMVYMIPLSISMTMTILVGYEVGARRWRDARLYSYIGIVFSVLFSGTAALLLTNFKPEIALLYSKDNTVCQFIEIFLAYAIFLQFSDAVSAPLQGILRGYKDVKITLILAIISYWVAGLPLGYILATYGDYGPYGYWIGLIAGIFVGAIFLALRLRTVQRQLLNKA